MKIRWTRWLLPPLLMALAGGLAYTVVSLPDQGQGLQSAVASQLDKSGVTNPVTAVLLNFRGYDTLLEMVVLLLALLGVWSLGASPPACAQSTPGPVLDTLTRLLVPLLIVVAGYVLWAGAHAPGGAFQAGALLGAAGVLLTLTGRRFQRGLRRRTLRVALAAGVAAFLAVAVLTLQGGRELLEYPPAQAGLLILLIEAAATVSIGLTLAALFLGNDPTEEYEP